MITFPKLHRINSGTKTSRFLTTEQVIHLLFSLIDIFLSNNQKGEKDWKGPYISSICSFYYEWLLCKTLCRPQHCQYPRSKRKTLWPLNCRKLWISLITVSCGTCQILNIFYMKWLSCVLSTSLYGVFLSISRLLRARSSLTFRQL